MHGELSTNDFASERWNRIFYLMLGLVFIWRVVFLFVSPLDLAPDEAYYWDWGRWPAWGYYSKPPMIAWINAATRTLFGVHDWAVRLPAAIFSSGAILLLFLLARRMFDSRTAFWAGAATLAAPGSSAAGFVMTIDAPLIFFWALALYSSWRIFETKGTPWLWGGLLMLALALGMLSKQMMMIFILCIIIFLSVSAADRFRLKRPMTWAILFLPILSLLPSVLWNHRHLWITFQHTAHHFDSGKGGLLKPLATMFEFIGSQLGVVSPVTFSLLAVGGSAALFTLKRQSRENRYLLIFSVLPLYVFLLLSLRQGINPNWPAAYYPAGMIFLSAWAFGKTSEGDKLLNWKRAFLPGVYIGAVLALIVYVIAFVLGPAGLPLKLNDPTKRMRGWSDFSSIVTDYKDSLPDKDKTFIMATSRQYCAEIAFYGVDNPVTYRWPGVDGIIGTQYEIWSGPEDKKGWNALIVQETRWPLPDELVKCFREVERLKDYEVPISARDKRKFSIYVGRELVSWPADPLETVSGRSRE